MNVSILRKAAERRQGVRVWTGLHMGLNTGKVWVAPCLGRRTFWWAFHEHRGGRGGKALHAYRADVKEMCRNLIKHQPA